MSGLKCVLSWPNLSYGFALGQWKFLITNLCLCRHWTESPEATWKGALTSVFLHIRKERKVNLDSFNQHWRTHSKISAKCYFDHKCKGIRAVWRKKHLIWPGMSGKMVVGNISTGFWEMSRSSQEEKELGNWGWRVDLGDGQGGRRSFLAEEIAYAKTPRNEKQ